MFKLNNKNTKLNNQELRLNEIINLVENYTRTAKHLETHSNNISSPNKIAEAKDIQARREDAINHLKDKILCNENSSFS